MMLQTGSCHCFPFFFLLCTIQLRPTLAYLLKGCTVVYSDNDTAGVSVDCSGRDLVCVPDDIPKDVMSITLRNNQIREIHRADFDHLSNLRDLDLSLNAITCVDDWAFVHLVELKVLNMDNNKLTILADNVFQGLSNLLVLSLDRNEIQCINPAAFQSLASLQELSLDMLMSNQMTDIISILQLPRLQVFNISIHELESFQMKDMPLNMTSELRELRVQGRRMKRFSIATPAFPHLVKIDMSLCSLSEWEWDTPDKHSLMNITMVYLSDLFSFNSARKTLQRLDSLECLHLIKIKKLIKSDLLNIACKIPTLRTLKIWNNNLRIANLSELSNCTQLTNLDLSLNVLTELTKGSIKEMKLLSHLNVSFNRLSKVPDDVKNLSMLQVLDLHYNNIHDLRCSDFFNLTRLTHLHLDDNSIYELKPCVFQHLRELKVLTVSRNSIWTVGDTFKTGLQKLELVDLNGNLVSKLNQGGFTSLKSLKRLDIDLAIGRDWNITYFEGLDGLETLVWCLFFRIFRIDPMKMLPPLEMLKTFTIQFSPQKYDQFGAIIEGLLRNMTHLEHFKAVNIYYHLGTQLRKDTFKHVPRLKTLTIRSTNIPHMHRETFDPIPNLEALSLSDNKLKSLDFLEHANMTRLSWLDLSQNELSVINVSVFLSLPALRYLSMAGNPLVCDCSNSDTQQWMLNNNQTQVLDANRYICAYPLAKRGTRFLDFDYRSCEQVDAAFICYISSTCVIVLTMLTSFSYHFLRLHLLYGYYLFLAFLYEATESKRRSPQRLYDAFISYNVHDELWVYREMLPMLEGEQGWRLCLHHRDFEPGKPIIENITDAIYGSRKIICVISHHYLESEWCSREIQMASYRLFDEQKDVLILVFLEDIPAHRLSPYHHMRRLVKRHTYLSWPQAGQQHPGLFWQSLHRALDTPHADLGSGKF